MKSDANPNTYNLLRKNSSNLELLMFILNFTLKWFKNIPYDRFNPKTNSKSTYCMLFRYTFQPINPHFARAKK